MCIEGVGAAGDIVEMELDVGAAARFDDPLMDARHVLQATELLLHVFAPIHSTGRKIWVELEGMPVDIGIRDASGREGCIQPPLAHEAPGADDVGEDVYAYQRVTLA